MASDSRKCPTCPIFSKHKVEFHTENSLCELFNDLFKTECNSKIKEKNMLHYGPQFEKICQNINIYLGSDKVEGDIFKAIEYVMKRDFEEELKAKIVQILVPKIFLSKFPHVIDFDEYIKRVEDLKINKAKGQLISKFLFGVIILTKKPMKILKGFLP